jgi:membrane protease YdiL (CAAX protease family)
VKPLVAFFALAYAITAALTVLMRYSLAFGVLGLFGPAAAALIVCRWTEGPAGVRELWGRVIDWRHGVGWYVTSLGLPVGVAGLAVALSALLGYPVQIRVWPITALTLVLFVAVVGEEIGWRGYALPRLLRSLAPLPATLLLGALWAGWHLPTFFLQTTPQAHFPFPAYVVYTCALSVLLTWLAFRTRGSVFVATVFHGAVNALGLSNDALTPETRNVLMAAAYAVAALVVAGAAGGHLGRPADGAR